MKKLFVLLVFSLLVSSQTFTLEEMDLCIKSTFKEDTEFLKSKGFEFLKNNYHMNSLSVMGETFWVTYQNSNVNKKRI